MFSQKFIKATENYCTYEKPVNAPYIRKSFEINKIPQKAELTLTCTGFYRLFVNGNEITASRLAPAITNPDEILFYDKYDLKEFLTEGKNCIAFMLGNGFSNPVGGYIWGFDKAPFRTAPLLSVHFESDSLSFEADESFKCAPSPIYFDDLRSGEFYDANLEIKGWNTPSFDDSEWTCAINEMPPRGKAVLNETDKIVCTKELLADEVCPCTISPAVCPEIVRPASKLVSETAFYKPEDEKKGIVFKFSENTACVPHLKIKGKKGQKIIIQCSEFCDENNVVNYEDTARFYPKGFCQRDIYICSGEGVEEYIPSFTYHGARYFVVFGLLPDQISKDTLTMQVINSDLKRMGDFECSDEVANLLQKASDISDLANFVYFPTDCPHREKNGWTGDISLSAEHLTQKFQTEKSFAQYMRQLTYSMPQSGLVYGIVPSYSWNQDYGPMWNHVIIEIPYILYIYRGNKEVFKEHSDSVFRYLNYLSKDINTDGFVTTGLGDWVHAMRQDASDFVCPIEVSNTAAAYASCKKAEFMFRICDMPLQADFAKALGEKLRNAMREKLIDYTTMTMQGSCQSAQCAGIYYGIFEPSEMPAAYKRLVEIIHESGDKIDCGIVGLRTMFRILAEGGDADLAYRMITSTKMPAFGAFVKKFGLASIPESFKSSFVESANGYSTSLNHHFLCDFSGFFISNIAGLQVNPKKDNPCHVKIAPSFVSNLDYAKAHYETVAGKVSVMWERCGDKIKLTVEKPEEVFGEVLLPKGYEFVSVTDKDSNHVTEKCWNENALWAKGKKQYKLASAVYMIQNTK